MPSILRKILGIILIIIGIAGLFLPILQGILLILLGAAMINDNFNKWLKNKLEKLKKKLKKK